MKSDAQLFQIYDESNTTVLHLAAHSNANHYADPEHRLMDEVCLYYCTSSAAMLIVVAISQQKMKNVSL